MRSRVIPGLLAIAALVVGAPSSGREMASRCVITADDIVFGSVEALQRHRHETIGSITVRCEGGGFARVFVDLMPDDSGPGRFALGKQDGAPAAQLFLDPGNRIPWGDGNAGTFRMERRLPADGRPVQIPVYARLEYAQAIESGQYARSLALIVHVEDEDGP